MLGFPEKLVAEQLHCIFSALVASNSAALAFSAAFWLLQNTLFAVGNTGVVPQQPPRIITVLLGPGSTALAYSAALWLLQSPMDTVQNT